nr:serine/threonine-protein kinase [Kibdelosporangium sp. MJ126-NF4]CEL14670.1 serine/threonine protein kinase [Kibdelosporangium sp. MJ126-NF4]CTQ96700.1 serine/threonine protein kinase [Kibdelosporangium sp. MJ126-NF4]
MIEQIGRYRVSGLLGTGAFASVWRAQDDMLGGEVAIKVLADNWSRHLDVRERFLTEARLLRQADSDRILRVFDIGELPDGRPYFVTALAELGSLEDRLAAGPLSVQEASAILVDVAEAVTVLHDMGVVHRDLKPSNVLFRAREGVVLADLGLAKALTRSSGLTQVAGSPGYMAPEQARPGAIVDERTDVYGLGALAYKLFTGVSVGEPGGTPLPKSVSRVVSRALRSDPGKRWPDARTFSAELRLRRRSRLHLIPLAAVLVVLVAVLTFPFPRWDATERLASTPVPTVVPTPPAASGSVSASNGVPEPPLSMPTTAIDPATCRAVDLKISMNEAGQFDGLSADAERWGLGIFFEAKKRQCTIEGYLGDFRFVLADGRTLERAMGDGVGMPKPVPLDATAVAQLDVSWPRGKGKAENPVKVEFVLPGTPDVVTLPWKAGPVGADGQIEVGPITTASQ